MVEVSASQMDFRIRSARSSLTAALSSRPTATQDVPARADRVVRPYIGGCVTVQSIGNYRHLPLNHCDTEKRIDITNSG